MNAEDLLIFGAIGAAVYFVMKQSTTAAASTSTSPVPSAPTINVQPSTVPLSNPISSLATPAPVAPLIPTPGPIPTPTPAPVMAVPPAPTGILYTGPAPPPLIPTPAPTPGPSIAPPIPLGIAVSSDPAIPSPGPIPPPPTVQPGIVPTTPAPVSSIQVAPAPAPAPVYNPVFTYQLSRPGTTLHPGDTWSVSITGAKPGSIVAMMLSQNGGNSVNNTMGTVNSAGNFSYAGMVNTGSDGQWSQLWFVNGNMIGSVGFTVFDPVVDAVAPTTTYNANIANTPIGTASNPRTGNLIIGGVVYGGSPGI